jgi:hypothetical protein
VLTFRNNVNESSSKRTATLYALYEYYDDPIWKKYREALTITVQDGACGCPVKVGTSSWAMLDCHNCGANRSQNPQTASYSALRGAYFMWGYGLAAWRDRNQNRHDNSSYVGPVMYKDKSPAGDITWNDYYPFDGGYPTTWSFPFDPCPSGWVMGSQSFWKNVENYNTWDSNHRSRIIDIGRYVDLPKQGYYHSSAESIRYLGKYDVAYTGDRYDYWTNSQQSTGYGHNFYGVDVNNDDLSVDTWGNIDKFYAEPVRCVQYGNSSYGGGSQSNAP